MIFKSRVRAVIFSILLLGSTSNGWGVDPSSEESQDTKRITRKITRTEWDEVKREDYNRYDNRKKQVLMCAINFINYLAPLIIVFYSAYFAYHKGQKGES